MEKEAKEVKKAVKQTLTKGEVLDFNEAWKGSKVKSLSPELTKSYFYLKVKISEHVKATQKQLEDGQKTLLEELGYTEGMTIPKEKLGEAQKKVNDLTSKILEETVEVDTKIMPESDLFDNLLNISENDAMTTESKSIVMKYLLKD